MYRVASRFTFEAAHRLIDAYSEECVQNVHGHSYKVSITVASPTLNEDGMVMDFKLLKAWWSENFSDWDHSIFLHKDDPIAGVLDLGRTHILDVNPTAENMAAIILKRLQETDFRPSGGSFTVSVQETENNIATVSEDTVKGIRFS